MLSRLVYNTRSLRSVVRSYSDQVASNQQGEALYLRPADWKGLSPHTIIELYWKRRRKLGERYKPSKDELDALLTTSEYTGTPVDQIKSDYESNLVNPKDTARNRERELFLMHSNKATWEKGLESFKFDELPTIARDNLARLLQLQEYQRIAAFELPLLMKYREEYVPPRNKDYPIKYRYTTYLGEEEHPNNRKVVLTCYTKNLGLDAKQLHKFRLLARERYDHTTDLFKMSSDKFIESAQNARYLHDVLQNLIKESKDLSKDDFSDIPLDRTNTIKRERRKKHKRNIDLFPAEWRRPEDAPGPTTNLLKEVIES